MRNLALRSLTAIALVTAVACNGDTATGVAAMSAPLLAKASAVPTTTTALVREVALPTDVVATAVIGPRGGSFSVPGTGLTIEVAKGAVEASTTFSATALAGSAIAYDFLPHRQFGAAITLTQDFGHTNADAVVRQGFVPQAAYFADRAAVNTTTGEASVSELVLSNVDVKGHKLSADVHHFSGYLMSSGRR